MKPAAQPELSVVILSYRSGVFAKKFHDEVKKTLNINNISYEIILVGNYWPKSDDITPKVIKEIARLNKKTRAITKRKTLPIHNMGWDMREGLKATVGKYIAVIDGDGQMNIDDIPRLFKKIKKEKYDLYKTRRAVREDGVYRLVVSYAYNLLMQLLFSGIAKDINSKPKIFTREVYKKLKLVSNDWFIDAEIMIKARHQKLKIGEIKTKFLKNPSRRSFVTFKENFEFIKNIIKWRLAKL